MALSGAKQSPANARAKTDLMDIETSPIGRHGSEPVRRPLDDADSNFAGRSAARRTRSYPNVYKHSFASTFRHRSTGPITKSAQVSQESEFSWTEKSDSAGPADSDEVGSGRAVPQAASCRAQQCHLLAWRFVAWGLGHGRQYRSRPGLLPQRTARAPKSGHKPQRPIAFRVFRGSNSRCHEGTRAVPPEI